jgi:Asp-tRNA(Asn)/Glu-tRNA(Gln) amidotransferase A subunit family amidase
MESYDVLLAPTLAKPPVELGTLMPSGANALQLRALLAMPNASRFLGAGALAKSALPVYEFIDSTPLANATGAPAISLPLAWSASGVPLGMMFTARFGDEAVLIRLAAQLEAAFPWFDRLPPLAEGSRPAPDLAVR